MDLNLLCRPPGVADAEAIAEAHVMAWQHAYAAIMPESYLRTLSPADSRVRWAALLESDASGVTVVEALGAVRGFARYGLPRDADSDSRTRRGLRYQHPSELVAQGARFGTALDLSG